MLAVRNLETYYGPIMAVRGVNLDVPPGEIVTVLGANGTGKSTLSMTISVLVKPWRGSICFKGGPIEGRRSADIVAQGLIHVPEGRRIFPNMTVRENLDLGCYRRGHP